MSWFGTRSSHAPLRTEDQDVELEAAFSGAGNDALPLPDQPYDAPREQGIAEQPTQQERQYDAAEITEEPRVPGAYDFEANPTETSHSAVILSAVQPSTSTQPPLTAQSRKDQLLRRLVPDFILRSKYGRLATSDRQDSSSYHRRLPLDRANDGVFANLSAKPEVAHRVGDEYVGGDDMGDKEPPPARFSLLPCATNITHLCALHVQSYDAAAADATPPYWETTIMAPSGYGFGSDEILVQGLPVGNLFGFAWNMLVSSSFQFVGFLLTYLLHTTHAAKHGSRAGLGITLIQYSFFLRNRASLLQDELDNNEIPPELLGAFAPANSTSESLWQIIEEQGGDPRTAFTTTMVDGLERVIPTATAYGPIPTTLPELSEQQRAGLTEAMQMSSMANDWMSYLLMLIGWALLFGSLFAFYKAWKYARAIRGENPTISESTEAPPTIVVS